MEHERMRWDYMGEIAMERRLYKMTTLDKLDCFIILANEKNKHRLRDLAIERRRQLDPHTGTDRQIASVFGRINFEF